MSRPPTSGLIGQLRLRRSFDHPVDRRPADTEQVGDLGGGVLAGLEQGHNVRLARPVQLGRSALQPTLGPGPSSSPQRSDRG